MNFSYFWKKSGLLLLATVFLFTLIAGFAAAADQVRYTKINIHTQSKDGKLHKASYANYTNPGAGHVIIPAGSKIVVTKLKSKAIYFDFDDGKQCVFEFHKQRMGMSVEDYLDKISSVEPVSLNNLSKRDRQGVEQGVAMIGMSRAGVMAALGYPATHKTPSLDAKTWIYWTNRFGTYAVDFDDDGKVIRTRD